jgi:hypothetical protein
VGVDRIGQDSTERNEQQASFGLGLGYSRPALADVVFLLWDAAFEFTSLHFATLQLTPPYHVPLSIHL